MNPRMKRVLLGNATKRAIPRILPPIGRPETPRDSRSLLSSTTSYLANLSVTDLQNANPSESPLQNACNLLATSHTAGDLIAAAQAFSDGAADISNRGVLSPADQLIYHQIYPLLSKLLNSAPGQILILIVKGLRDLLSAVNFKGFQPRPPPGVSPRRVPRTHRFVPLAPLKEDNAICEHFQEFIAKVLYKMSGSTNNDPYFMDDSVIDDVIAMIRQDHKIGARTYCAAVLRNESHSQEFRTRLISFPSFPDVLAALGSPVDKVDFYVQVTGVIRNLIVDMSNMDFLIAHHVHVLLFRAIDQFPTSVALAFNAFRILTKVSDHQSVRSDLLEQYTGEGIVIRLLQLIDQHRSDLRIISRVAYVFAEFSAREPIILSAAGQLSTPVSVSLLPQVLSSEEIQADRGVAALLVQVIANLSVDPACSAMFTSPDFLACFMPQCTFDANDRFGFNLLCAA
jgi:hypothetical protein